MSEEQHPVNGSIWMFYVKDSPEVKDGQQYVKLPSYNTVLNTDRNVLYTNNRIKMENTSKYSQLKSENVSTPCVVAQKCVWQILTMVMIFSHIFSFPST